MYKKKTLENYCENTQHRQHAIAPLTSEDNVTRRLGHAHCRGLM